MKARDWRRFAEEALLPLMPGFALAPAPVSCLTRQSQRDTVPVLVCDRAPHAEMVFRLGYTVVPMYVPQDLRRSGINMALGDRLGRGTPAGSYRDLAVDGPISVAEWLRERTQIEADPFWAHTACAAQVIAAIEASANPRAKPFPRWLAFSYAAIGDFDKAAACFAMAADDQRVAQSSETATRSVKDALSQSAEEFEQLAQLSAQRPEQMAALLMDARSTNAAQLGISPELL